MATEESKDHHVRMSQHIQQLGKFQATKGERCCFRHCLNKRQHLFRYWNMWLVARTMEKGGGGGLETTSTLR